MKRLLTTAFVTVALLASPVMAQAPDHARHDAHKEHRHDRQQHRKEHREHRKDHKEQRHDEHHQ